ncbi:three-Cys-motif partner protein TcmP [Desertibaculum subflavum]|uniref:three-Cys-motif partner protein TcmP n=1 Tax=Desertibaculum subflavum TaxID=2268458 RepID=UPI000E665345
MVEATFFEERKDQSEVKARIVVKYFVAWSRVILPSVERYDTKLAYIDLYAGPGRYKDGSASTPLLILQTAVADPRLSKRLVTLFNDVDDSNTATLQTEIDKLPGVEKLDHKPHVSRGAVDDDAERYFNETRLVPSFTFIDPWGYKGLSLKVVNGVIKDWGCDCVFFFNYNRINPGLSNDIVAQHMEALFGPERAKKLRQRLDGLTPSQRESMVLEEMTSAIKEMGGKYVLPFRFKNPSGRPTHHLIFVSKSFRGYDIMKQIMSKESSTEEEGVPSFTYSPADASMPLLFSLQQPLSELRSSLLETFAGQELSTDQIFERHSVDRRFLLKNYKDVLSKMEEDGEITVRSVKVAKRRKETFPGHLLVRFPARASHG